MRARVLVIDDSLTVRKDLEEAFDGAGFDSTLCDSIAAARRALGEHSDIELVLLDVILPDGDGVALLAELKAAPATAAIPVVLLSSESEVRDRVRGLRTGADEYVGKPYDATYLVSRARELIGRRDAGAASPAAATVLVIDDSPTFREGLRLELERAGYSVVTASTGEEGLRTAVGLMPGAVIVDGSMPGIDGATVIRRMRQDAVLRRTPCMLLTASEDRRNEVRALEAGADAYVRKEDEPTVILRRLGAILRSASASAGGPEARTSFLGPKKILAVDDSATFLQELAAQLRDESYDVVPARSGTEALEMLAVQNVDGILLDLEMPGLSGAETCRRIKSTPAGRAVPVLILTARDDANAMIDSMEAGADDYVPKSSDFEILKARLRAQLRRKQFDEESRVQELAVARAALLSEVQQKNAELLQANRLKTEFLANMSHELRTPLNSIIGFTEVLIDQRFGELNERQRRYLTNVNQSGRHLLRLINDLLDQSKIEAGRLEVARQRCAARHLTYDAATTVQPLADAKRITLVTDARDAPPLPFVSGDMTRLRQVIYNLLANAIKFTPEGGRVEVRSELCADGVHVRTTVTDSGPGIPPEELPRLFTPFTQLPSTRDLHVTGTGLGLALSKKLVELMGGRIGVESEAGHGARFWVELPIYDAANESSA
ncbi:MAG TPA: response regulator [Polyangia bacterium]|nr:response regulator [Polyangia bacterium]